MQTADCETGLLWQNCDSERPDIFDHETHQIFEDAEATYELGPECIAIVFGFDGVSYGLAGARLDYTEISLWIDIVCHDNSGAKRQDILDTVEERILYRLLSFQTFTDATTGEPLPSFLRWVDKNEIKIESRDDDMEFAGSYTIRRMRMQLTVRDCIQKPDCGDVPLCFDFDNVTRLDNSC